MGLEIHLRMTKIDIVLMNPPYGMGTDTIHLKFVDKCLDICNKQIVVMPFKFITKERGCYYKYKEKEKWNNYLKEVEEVDSKLFKGTAMENVAIYTFDKDNIDKIKINTISKKYDQIIKNISDYKETSEYEESFLKYLYNDHIANYVVWAGGIGGANKKHLLEIGITNKNEQEKLMNQSIIDNSKRLKNLKDYNVFLVMLNVTTNKFFSPSSEAICKSPQEVIDYAIKQKLGKGFQVMGLKTIKEAENCKAALKRPLMRFGLTKAHSGMDIVVRRSFKYVPDIDWSDDRVKTDEGLLEVCGCPKDKCKEYADYCKKIIEEVDRKK